MLEIFILFALGRAINRKASAKGWPGWPFVLIMLFLYLGCGFAVGIAAVIAWQLQNQNAGDDLLPGLLGFYAGAVCGAIASFLVVGILPDRSEPEDDVDRRPRRAIRERDDDDRDVPKARRADDSDFRRRDY